MSTRHEVSSAMDFLTTDVILLFSHFAAGFTLLSFILLPILISFRCWVYFLVSSPSYSILIYLCSNYLSIINSNQTNYTTDDERNVVESASGESVRH